MHSRRRQSDIESESSAADDEVFGLAPPSGGIKGTVSLCESESDRCLLLIIFVVTYLITFNLKDLK